MTLDVHGLTGRVRGHPRLQSVSLAVKAGEIGAVFGGPRAGKRALVRMLAGLDPHEAGEIVVDGSSVGGLPTQRRRIGVVLRDAPMFPGTVLDNVAYGLRQQGWAKDDRERRVAAVLELVGMTGTEREPAAALNADERARIALARALAPEPPALLLESPTAYVDEVLKPDYRARLREVLRSLPMATLVFTDDLRDAVGLADDLHVLVGGHLRQSGPLSRVLAGPSSVEVAELVGYVTLVRGQVDGEWILEPGAGAIRFPAGFPLSGTARALAHPSAMLGVPESSGLGSGVTGRIERIRAVGPTYLLDLRVGDRLIEVRWEWDLAPPPDDEPISIAVTPGTLRFFNEATVGREALPVPEMPRPARSGARVPAGEPDDLDAREDDEPPAGEAEADRPEGDAPSVSEPDVEAAEASPASVPATAEFATAEAEMAEVETAEVETTGPADREAASDHVSGPSPAPAPPRTEPAGEPSRDEGEDSVAALAPWLQVSRPVPPPREPEDPEDLARRHQGMPLD